MKYLLVLLLFAASCSPQYHIFKAGTPALAEYCAQNFKPIVYDSTRIEYAPGIPIILINTKYINCDSIVSVAKTDTTVDSKRVPVEEKTVLQTDTVKATSKKSETNIAELAVYKRNLDIATVEATKHKERAKMYLYWAIVATVATVILLILKFK